MLTNIVEELFTKTEIELRRVYQSKSEKGTRLFKKVANL